jgi:signal transduction histidine kinase
VACRFVAAAGPGGFGFLHSRPMSFVDQFKQAWRHQRVLMKHRPDPLHIRALIFLTWAVGMGLLFAVVDGLKDGDLLTRHWWLAQVPGHVLVGLCISLSFFGCFRSFERLASQRTLDTIMGWRDWRSATFFSSFSIGCSLLGLLPGLWLVDLIWVQHGLPDLVGNPVFWREFLMVSVVISIISGLIYRARWKRELLQARATEAQFKLLQGQIEPHFLFNTLANVQSLIDFDPDKAKLMLERFTDYLRASLQQLRRDETSVAQEFGLLEAYLGLMQIRMGGRLQFRFEAGPGTEAAALPPLLVQPLVENAIHHGLEPKIEGGELLVSARREGADLVIEVADSGQGLNGPKRPGRKGNGIAVENIRSRLQGRWGPRASLGLADRPGGGTCATLRLPFTTLQA